VEIVNVAGSVRVIGWDRPEIRITGTLGRGTDRLAVDGGPGQTSIRVILARGGRNTQGSDLEIRVPTRKDVNVQTTSADIDVRSVVGGLVLSSTSGNLEVGGSPREVTAGSTSGDVGVSVSTRTVKASTTSGDVTVGGTVRESIAAKSVSGDVRVEAGTPELAAETVSGNLTVANVGRRASASTVSGDVSIRGGKMQYFSFESVSGNLRFSGELLPGAAFKVESHSGDIDLAFPPGVAADFEVTTFSGDIMNAFGPGPQRTNRYSPGSELRFSTGNGGLVAVRTFSGNVRLQKR
jgi:DUF4097 and DUF4098 domain-containing protein YvlB